MKKYNKQLLFLFLLLCQFPTLIAQTAQKEIKDLKVGDQCPDFELNNLINYSKSTVKLSDFRGKFIILDFWATWCAPCIKAVSALDSIQRTFKDDLMIFPVTYESKKVLKKFLSHNALLRNNQLPIITSDTILAKYFKHHEMSHAIIIDKNGIVIDIISAEEVTENMIAKLIAGEDVKLEQKNDIMTRDFTKPLLLGGLGDFKIDPLKIKYSSVITSYIKGTGGSTSFPRVIGDCAKIGGLSSPIQNLYQLCFSTELVPVPLRRPPFNTPFKDAYLFLNTRTIWEAKDSTLYYVAYKGSHNKLFDSTPDSVKYFNYELIIPKQDSVKINAYMLQDLNRYFGERLGIEGVVEKRSVKCWALTQIGNLDRIKSKGGDWDVWDNPDTKENVVKNQTIDNFLFLWLEFDSTYLPSEPIINEVDYPFPVDMKFIANPHDFQSMNQALKKFGLEFKLVERNLNMIIIRDIK